jgi:hypothetical protein
MKIKLIGEPSICPARNAWLADAGFDDSKCNCCGMHCCLKTEDAKRTGEQMRLLLSRDAVLRDLAPRAMVGCEW